MIDAGHLGPARGHRLGQYSAAAADIEHATAGKAGVAIDVVQPQWVDFVQRLELAVRIPPAGSEPVEFLDLERVDVAAWVHRLLPCRERPSIISRAGRSEAARGALDSAGDAFAPGGGALQGLLQSSVVSTPSRSSCLPATQTWLTCSRPAA
jgi:hypothetical protein